jgi:hypothetical protein
MVGEGVGKILIENFCDFLNTFIACFDLFWKLKGGRG